MSRKNRLYIEDILDAIEAIETFIEGYDFQRFWQDRKTYSATLRELMVIGEATAKIMTLLEENEPNYPWKAVKDFRNVVVHEYFGVDPSICMGSCKK